LEKGTYYIAQITVYGFEGSFVGMGQGVTIIQALPNLPSPAPKYNTATSWFPAGLPGPSNPWPALFTFVGGSFSISGMTITDPYTAPISSPGWYFPPTSAFSTAVWGLIGISGGEYLHGVQQPPQVSAAIDHVTMIGASGDAEGTNMWNGIIYGGVFLPPGYTKPMSQAILISGTFSVTNSIFNTMESGPWVRSLDGATVTVCYNTAINDPGITYGFFDSYNSKLTFCGNRGSASQDTAAMGGIQDFYVPPPTGVAPSTVYVTNNNFQASQGANAVYLSDGVDTLKAIVSGNTLTIDSACTSTWEAEGWCYNAPKVEWYSSAVVTYSLINFVVSQNTIFGGATGKTSANGIYVTGGPGQVSGNTVTGSYIGVWLDAATGVLVTGNVIKNSAEYGIALTQGSSNNVISGNIITNSRVDDLYWDKTGTGNVWKSDVCVTSSPPGLCT
jgi:parallel beta-helix repeat protein